MPNNITFNRVAEQLQTQINGVDENGVVRQLLTTTGGMLQVTIPTSETITTRALSAAVDSIKISSVLFSETSTTFAGVVDSAAIFAQDTSEQKTYSFYVYNTGTNTVTCKLQVSPTTVDAYYTDDTSGEVGISPDDKYVFFTNEFMKYTRLFYETSGAACTFEVHYNAQV